MDASPDASRPRAPSSFVDVAVRGGTPEDRLLVAVARRATAESGLPLAAVPAGGDRADLAVVHDDLLVGYVLADGPPAGLRRRAAALAPAFDRLVLVAPEGRTAGAAADVPDWWGLTAAGAPAAPGGMPRLRGVRPALANPVFDPAAAAAMLTDEEATDALRQYGGLALRARPPADPRGAMVRGMDPDTVRHCVRHFLDRRALRLIVVGPWEELPADRRLLAAARAAAAGRRRPLGTETYRRPGETPRAYLARCAEPYVADAPRRNAKGNDVFPVSAGEVLEGERVLGRRFPEALRSFWTEVGCGFVQVPWDGRPGRADGFNRILGPVEAAELATGTHEFADYYRHSVQPGDVPFFEAFENGLLVVRPGSGNAVAWGFSETGPPVSDSFDAFLASLVEDPLFFSAGDD